MGDNMAHFVCKCGHDMWNGESPNDIEFWVYSDKTMDALSYDDAIPFLALHERNDYNVWRCHNCKRLYIFDEKISTDKPVCIYKTEE